MNNLFPKYARGKEMLWPSTLETDFQAITKTGIIFSHDRLISNEGGTK
jgi:hypothetical protein